MHTDKNDEQVSSHIGDVVKITMSLRKQPRRKWIHTRHETARRHFTARMSHTVSSTVRTSQTLSRLVGCFCAHETAAL